MLVLLVSLLLVLSGSVVEVLTVAVLFTVISVVITGAVTLIIISVVTPLANELFKMSQVTIPLFSWHVQSLPVTLILVSPCGKVSVT